MKPPTFQSIKPSPPVYISVSPLQERQLKAFLPNISTSPKIERMETRHVWPVGFYRSLDDGIFFKLFSYDMFEIEKCVHDLETYLHGSGLGCRVGLLSEVDFLEKKYCLITYEYWEYQFFQAKEQQIISLAENLRKMHQLFLNYPGKDATESAWLARWSQFLEIFSNIKKMSIPSQAKEKLVAYRTIFSEFVKRPSQVVHGDINYGNVLFLGNEAQIIDFETALDSFFPVAFDLAMVLERFCFNGQTEAQAEALASIFLKAYCAEPFDLATAIICVSLRSLLILCQRKKEGIETLPDEWNKFVFLINWVESSTDWLKVIEEKIWQ